MHRTSFEEDPPTTRDSENRPMESETKKLQQRPSIRRLITIFTACFFVRDPCRFQLQPPLSLGFLLELPLHVLFLSFFAPLRRKCPKFLCTFSHFSSPNTKQSQPQNLGRFSHFTSVFSFVRLRHSFSHSAASNCFPSFTPPLFPFLTFSLPPSCSCLFFEVFLTHSLHLFHQPHLLYPLFFLGLLVILALTASFVSSSHHSTSSRHHTSLR